VGNDGLKRAHRPEARRRRRFAVAPPRIDARAKSRGDCLRWFCRRRNFVRQCSLVWRVVLLDPPLKTELPGVLKGLKFGASRGKPVSIIDIRQLVYLNADEASKPLSNYISLAAEPPSPQGGYPMSNITGVRAKARCLLIHAEAFLCQSVSLSLSLCLSVISLSLCLSLSLSLSISVSLYICTSAATVVRTEMRFSRCCSHVGPWSGDGIQSSQG
jgi:hypothetical protein